MKNFQRFILFLSCISYLPLFGQKINYEGHDLFKEGRYKEYEQVLLSYLRNDFSKLTKPQKISYYTDLGKVNIIFKKYSIALQYLIQAKSLNKEDSSQYTHYYVAFGELFKEIGANSVSIEYYKKAYYSDINNLGKYYQANTLGSLYLNINQFDSAVYYFKSQLNAGINLSDYIAKASSINNIGIAYSQKGDQKTALEYFFESRKIMEENQSKISKNFEGEKVSFYNNILENIGRCYFKLKIFEKAILFNHQNYIFKSKNIGNRLLLESNLVTSYLKLNQPNKAKKIESDLFSLYTKMSLDAKYDFINLQLEISLFEKNISKCSLLISKIKEINRLREKERIISNDRMNSIVSKLLIYEAETKINSEKKQKNQLVKLVKLEQKENVFITILLIMSIFIFLVLGVLFYQYTRNKRKKSHLEKAFLILEDEKQKLKIKAQENYLTEFAIENNLKKEYSKELLKNLNHLISLNEEDIKKEIKRLIFDLKNKELSDKSVEELNDHSELLLLNFKTNLFQIHPNLNKSDIELCCLIKLNLSNKEIASHKNVTDDSIKIFKNRLKKKLNLESSVNLNTYIMTL